MNNSTTISILSTNCSDSKITLNYEAIETILTKVGELPLCILSINGKFRKGKSLMLNFFLQYLRARTSQNNPNPVNWFQPTQVGRDFNWRGGIEAETNGINIYSEPFKISINGQPIAILLMDTQGSFDDQSTFQHNAVIFALSSLLSSVMVMNIEHDVTEDMLQFFQFFAGFAQLALQNEDSDNDTSTLFAQNLLFLVRDFQWIQQFRLGQHDDTTADPNYKKEKLNPSPGKSEEANFLRKDIAEMFPRVAVNLLPHPGNGLACNSVLDSLDPFFKEGAISFVENRFLPQNVIKKTISGEMMTGNKLKPYVRRWQSVFENDTPTVKNLTQATAEVQNLMALANADKNYDLKMKEFFVENPNGVADVTFKRKTESLKIECFAVFKQTKKIGGKIYEDKYSEDLNKLLDSKTESYKQLNCERLKAAEDMRKLDQAKQELIKQYNNTVDSFNTLKKQSESEIKKWDDKLQVITHEMNQSLEDNKQLREQHMKLDSELLNIRSNADTNRKNYEQEIQQMKTIMDEQARNHEARVMELNIAIANASKPKRRGGFGFVGDALGIITGGLAGLAANKIMNAFPK